MANRQEIVREIDKLNKSVEDASLRKEEALLELGIFIYKKVREGLLDNEEINEKEATKKINEVYKKIIPLNYLLIKLDEIYGFIFVKDLHKYAEFMFNNKLI